MAPVKQSPKAVYNELEATKSEKDSKATKYMTAQFETWIELKKAVEI